MNTRGVGPTEPTPGNSARLWGGFLYAGAVVCFGIALLLIAADFDRERVVLYALYGIAWACVGIALVVAGAANRVVGDLRDRLGRERWEAGRETTPRRS